MPSPPAPDPALPAGPPPPAAPAARFTTIVVVGYRSADTIGACLESVARCTPEPHEVVFVDNASEDGGAERARTLGARVLRNASNLGFSVACNQGIEATAAARSRDDCVVLLNPDTIVTPGWLGALLAPLRGDVAATGPLSTYVAADQRVALHAGRIPGTPPRDPIALAAALARHNAGRTVETRLLIGFCLALRRDLLARHGGLDPRLFLGNDDLEYSHRMRRLGYRLLVATDSFVLHEGQRSFRSLPSAERERLVQESTDALQAKLEDEYGEGRVPPPEQLWGIEWFRPRRRELVSIVIPAWNNARLTRTCLGAIERYTAHPHEVIVVDNGSTDETPGMLASMPGVRTIRNETNRGYAAATNQGLRAARGRHFVLLNNDVVVTPGWLETLLEHVRLDPRIGILGPRTNFASGPQLVPKVGYGSLDGLEAYARDFAKANKGLRMVFPRVTGLCMLVTGRCREAVGLLDERFGLGNFEDDDYCLRAIQAGFQCAIAGDVFVHHFGSQTFKQMKVDYAGLLAENRAKFMEKWKDLLPAGTQAR